MMADLEIDVYDLLKRNGLLLAPHIINILKDLGYSDLRTLAQISGPADVEKFVVDSFGASEDYAVLTEEEKKKLLGPKCWRTPNKFKFQPMEKVLPLQP